LLSVNLHDDTELLVGEADERDASVIAAAVASCDFAPRTHHVRNGIEVVDFVRCSGRYANRNPSHRPKLILLAAAMPELDGLSALRSLRMHQRSSGIPIVTMLARGHEAAIETSYEFGANGVIVKPDDAVPFTEMVLSICRYWFLVNRVPV
jgi:two-component system response regulator